MYSSYGSYRLFAFLFFFATIVGLVLYKRRTALRSIKGSVLEAQIKNLLAQNPRMNDILRQRNKSVVEYEDLVGGGVSDGRFNCVMYVRNLTNGRVEFSGQQSEDTGKYKLDRLELKYI